MNRQHSSERRRSNIYASGYGDLASMQKSMNEEFCKMEDIMQDMKADMQDVKAILAIISAKLNINTPIKCSKSKSSQVKRKNILSSVFNVKKEPIFKEQKVLSKLYSDKCTVERRNISSCSNLPIGALRGSKIRLIPRSMDLKEEIFHVDEKVQVNVDIASSEMQSSYRNPEYDDIYQDTTADLEITKNPLHEESKNIEDTRLHFELLNDSESDLRHQSSPIYTNLLDISISTVEPHISLSLSAMQIPIVPLDLLMTVEHMAVMLITMMEFLLCLFSAIWFEVLLWWIEGFV